MLLKMQAFCFEGIFETAYECGPELPEISKCISG